MGTGAKIAIGCGVVLAAGAILMVAVLGGTAYWLKGKTEEFAADQARIDELQKRANANPFTPPAGGELREDRLVKFLEVRRRVWDVYRRHESALEALREKEQGDLGDVRTAFNAVNELRLAVAQAQAEVGMSEAEYRYLVEQLYKTVWAAEVARANAGASEAAAQAMERAARDVKAAGGPGAEAEMTAQAERVRREAARLDVPEANLALYRKHESEIRKYAMGGLEWIGL